MGASISQRPGKCLKNTRRPRRSKSEECLGSKRSLTMGKLFAPWHHLVNVTEANAAAKMLEFTAADKEFSYEMEKSFNQIHRSSSLDKSSLRNKYGEKEFTDDDDYSNCGTKVEQFCDFNERRLVIDVNKDSIFEVNLCKGSRGLGFSVLEYDGFIFIKQLFPLEAASQSGLLQEGDIILSANGNALTHLSSFEALQILRKLDNAVTLIVCRLQQFLKKSPITSSQTFSHFTPLTTYDCSVQHKEFEVRMKKINGSLGFTLRKAEDGHRNHIVRALVKKPAIYDGRIKPGDQIISVNNREIGDMSHQEAVKFLRDCEEEVVLRLRRETLSSSLTSLSSSHFEDNNKTLRKEAVDMLNTLAVKKLKTECDNKLKRSSESDVILSASADELSNSKFDDNTDDDEEKEEEERKKKEKDGEVEEKYDDKEVSHFEGTFSNLLSQETSSIISRGVPKDCSLSDSFADIADEPVSLPALDLNGEKINFQHSDPAYHSMNVSNLSAKSTDGIFNQSRLSPTPASDNNGLLKWKGIVMDARNESTSNPRSNDATPTTIVVQLQRNWNSRLGFSLSYENNVTVISAIHENSVASNDGRLSVGDQILEINANDVRDLNTNEVIKLLRTVRGTVTITVSRSNLKPI